MGSMAFSDLQNTKNLRIRFEDNALYLLCDLSRDFGVSSSGKSTIIASSCGNKAIGKSNVFLGLNLFVKNLEKRQLTDKAVEKLQKEIFEPVGTAGLSWRIEDDGVTLCIKLSFGEAIEKPASSGKSVLLFSSLGNKEIASTGIMCGLNCYYPQGKPANVSALSEEVESPVRKGEERALSEFTRVKYGVNENGEEEVTVTVQLSEFFCENDSNNSSSLEDNSLLTNFGTKDGEKHQYESDENQKKNIGAISHSFVVGGVHVQFYISAITTKKRKIETPVATSVDGGIIQCEKSQNITSSLSKGNVLSISFNPTLSYGLSSSGKSISVASSSGFQPICSSFGVEVAKINFNAFQPSTSIIRASDVDRAVKEVLGNVSEDSRSTLSFRSIRDDVLKQLDLPENSSERYTPLIKEKVKLFLSQKDE